MPRHRPPTSGYARLSQADEELGNGYQDDSDEDDHYANPHILSASAPQYAPIQPQPQVHMQLPSDGSAVHRKRPGSRRRGRSNSSGVDIKAINARLERWAGEIASKFKINKVKGKSQEEEQLEIHYSVFQSPDGIRPETAETLQSEVSTAQEPRMTKFEYDDVVESVRIAIELGVHPKMISQGSSGSYFARNTDGKVVGVFKPKDEEPYASRNPKWTKWIHRNLFPCFFGRECLIPNLSYVSEAAAYVLDSRLRTNLVPYTDIVHLSSKSFYYDFWQRSAFYRKRKPLPEKVGSFQVFLKGFKDANIFLRDHPWPDQMNTGFRPEDAPKRKRTPWAEDCRPRGAPLVDTEASQSQFRPASTNDESRPHRFFWSEALQQSFREELEKLVILDYIMRNTDRGLDNWMIKVDWHKQEVSIVSEAPKTNNSDESHLHPIPHRAGAINLADPYRRQESMTSTSRSATPLNMHDTSNPPSISIGAIDNSLSWPWKHPDAVMEEFPIWVAISARVIDWAAIFTKDSRPFSSIIDVHRMVEPDTSGPAASLQSRFRLQGKDVCKTDSSDEGSGMECGRDLKNSGSRTTGAYKAGTAVPLRTPSAEMRRRTDIGYPDMDEEEEMDISAANGSSSKVHSDLLNFSPPTADLPNPNRFDLSRKLSSSDVGQQHDRNERSATDEAARLTRSSETMNGNESRPSLIPTRTPASYEGHRKRSSTGGHHRRYSHSMRGGTSSFLYDGDDLEGDLGYAAAEGMEGNQRKVIVERLETVKSKNPVFTWC
ncbi:phosphatidyl inositol kinase [Xylographa pallens]|nr:phosphatidyl inositol kinase [Xylographa pallens]